MSWKDGDFIPVRSAWDLTYEQPGEVRLVQTLAEFMTYCAQRRPDEDPEAVLAELVASGAILEAPKYFVDEAAAAGVLEVARADYTLAP